MRALVRVTVSFFCLCYILYAPAKLTDFSALEKGRASQESAYQDNRFYHTLNGPLQGLLATLVR